VPNLLDLLRLYDRRPTRAIVEQDSEPEGHLMNDIDITTYRETPEVNVNTFFRWAIGAVLATFLVGCGSGIQRNPVPESLVEVAQVKNLEGVRFWGDVPLAGVDEILHEKRWENFAERPHHYLALSGGGSNGAYGAGFVNGWTAAGTRPEFNLVTGISIGAVIAPFAFLGSEYDDLLKSLFTEHSTETMVKKRGLFAIFRHASVFDISQLRELLKELVTQEVVDKIGVEYLAGRFLYIGTTNLDAERPVIWSIGRIAASGDPRALSLIREIIVASAAIGATFPPIIFEVEANGETYDELHVDGGTVNQVFIYPLGAHWATILERFGVGREPNVYILRNGYLWPKYSAVPYKLTAILAGSLESLIRNQANGDLEKIYLQIQADGMNYYLTYIPDDFDVENTEMFDKNYMNKLYERGYEEALKGAPWERFPPGLERTLTE
jgi:predicted acylesterase/phospholipase RssA